MQNYNTESNFFSENECFVPNTRLRGLGFKYILIQSFCAVLAKSCHSMSNVEAIFTQVGGDFMFSDKCSLC